MKQLFYSALKNKIKADNIKVSLFPLLILSFLWSYGYMGALTRSSMASQIVITGCLIGILLFLFFIYEKYISKNGIDTIVISKNDLKIVSVILFTAILVGFDYIFYSLVNDELYHSYLSQFHAIYGLEVLSNRLPNFIVEQKASVLVWLISSSILISSIALLYYLVKWNFKHKYIFLSILILLFFRTAYAFKGGLDFPHPPFRLFPLWLSSTLFSPSNFSFRLPGVIALSLIGLIIYRVLKPKIIPPFLLWLVISTLLSIPLLWHSSYLVEPSIWAALFSILFLLAFQSEKFDKFNFYIWFLLLALFILMRQSLVFIALPMLFVFIMERKTLLFKNWKETAFILSPLLVALPFLIRSLLVGTPATGVGSEVQSALLGGVYNVVSSGMLKDIIINNFEIWSLFIIFAFIPAKKNRLKYFSTVVLFILSALIIFYSISPHLWGVPRYQAEYIVPLIILGAVKFLIYSYDLNNRASKYILSGIFSSLLAYNLYTISISHSHKEALVNDHSVILSRSVYDYETAFKAAKENGYAGNTLMLGVTYGAMNEVLYGYTLQEIEKQLQFYKEFNKFKGEDMNSLLQNKNIKLVMLSDIDEKKEYLRNELLENGFKEWKRFSSEKTTDEIIALVRNNINESN